MTREKVCICSMQTEFFKNIFDPCFLEYMDVEPMDAKD
jgi:hypothetical protein